MRESERLVLEARAAELIVEGLTTTVIAERLGCSQNVVRGAAHRRGIALPPSGMFTAEERDRIGRNAPYVGSLAWNGQR